MSCSLIASSTCHPGQKWSDYYPQMSRSISNAKVDNCSPEVMYIITRPLTLKTQSCNVRDGIKCHGPSMSMKCVAHDMQWQQWQPIAVQLWRINPSLHLYSPAKPSQQHTIHRSMEMISHRWILGSNATVIADYVLMTMTSHWCTSTTATSQNDHRLKRPQSETKMATFH